MKQGWKKLKGLFKSNRTSPGDGLKDAIRKKPSIADLIEELKKQKQEQKRKEASGEVTPTSNTLSPNGNVHSDNNEENKDKDDTENKSKPSNGSVPNKDVDDAFKTERSTFANFGESRQKSDSIEMTCLEGTEERKESNPAPTITITEVEEQEEDEEDEEEEKQLVLADCFPKSCIVK